MGNFKRGLFFGGLIGASFMWLSATKDGKKKRDEMLDHAAAIYEQLKEQTAHSGAWGAMSKNEYVTMARRAVEQYASEHALVGQVKETIVEIVGAQWHSIEKEMKKIKSPKSKIKR